MGFGRALDAELDAEAADDRIAFSMAKAGSCDLLWKGRRYANAGQRGVVFTSGPPKSLRFSEDGDAWGVVMNRPRIAAYCAKLLGCEIDGPIEFETESRLDDADGKSWVRLVQYATGEMSNPLSLVRQIPAARQQLEQLVLTGFLLAHRHTYSLALHQPQSAAAPHYVKRAEAYIEAHFRDPLSLADIAASAGVSARSLQNGFQSFRHMTPIVYLREVRLKHAHQALLKADPAFATVTDIAVHCGFTHLGQFTAHYSRAYGVSPRDTLVKKLKA
jgi:AraC-like DNA-binding protein